MSDNAQSICDNAKFKDVVKISIDIQLLNFKICGCVSWSKTMGNLMRIIRFIMVWSIEKVTSG